MQVSFEFSNPDDLVEILFRYRDNNQITDFQSWFVAHVPVIDVKCELNPLFREQAKIFVSFFTQTGDGSCNIRFRHENTGEVECISDFCFLR
ncbi:hypothetical protein SDC9_138806 [bioreactor metagenome]|uniref:Uncharacterized protein n=1 Tax=bioreactor metagenome TaxID=1076179 RepID=A0A645DQD5_9ZZZZ